jgi:hypothetical protein
MSETRNATHWHKTQGAVVLLESTAQLAKILIVDKGEVIWVKLAQLSEGARKLPKKRARRDAKAKDRPISPADSNHRIARVV